MWITGFGGQRGILVESGWLAFSVVGLVGLVVSEK